MIVSKITYACVFRYDDDNNNNKATTITNSCIDTYRWIPMLIGIKAQARAVTHTHISISHNSLGSTCTHVHIRTHTERQTYKQTNIIINLPATQYTRSQTKNICCVGMFQCEWIIISKKRQTSFILLYILWATYPN